MSRIPELQKVIRRILASLAQKDVTQSIVVRKLSSHFLGSRQTDSSGIIVALAAGLVGRRDAPGPAGSHVLRNGKSQTPTFANSRRVLRTRKSDTAWRR
jgi:hypothetical protein